MSGWKLLAIAMMALSIDVGTLAAQEQSGAAEVPLTFRYSLKSSALVSRMPDDPVLFPDRSAANALWRARIEPTVRFGPDVTLDAALEQRLQVFTSSSPIAAAILLPSTTRAPYRVAQLDWLLADGSNAEWHAEIDRAALHIPSSRAVIIVGRQAIGWGRGVLFGAVDLFAPFSPLEVDREWRRGVDAVRADVKLADRVSLDSVAAFDETIGRSAFAARLRGYTGKIDLEVLGGYRARDEFAGATTSAAVGDFELHGEAAVFRTDAVPGSESFSAPRSIVKAVVGGSYRTPLGNGVPIYIEYHYSGFGAESPEHIVLNLRDPVFQERYLRGDTQILGRHATALVAGYEYSPAISLSSQWLHSPADGSGIVVPSITYTANDRWSVLISGYLPYGRGPTGFVLRSEFGASPLAGFVQVRMYR